MKPFELAQPAAKVSTAKRSPFTRALTRFFKQQLKQSRIDISLVALSLLFLSVFNALLVFLVGPLVGLLFAGEGRDQVVLDELVSGRFIDYLPAYLRSFQIALPDLIFWLPFTIFVIAFFRAGALYVYQYHHQKISLKFSSELRSVVFARIFSLPFKELKTRNPGEYMAVLMNDIFVLQTKFAEIWMNFFRDVLMLVSAFVVLVVISPLSALIFIAVCPVFAKALGKSGAGISRYAKNWQDAMAEMTAFIFDVRKRIDFIQSQDGRQREVAHFDELNRRYFRQVRKSLWLRSTLAPGVEWLGFAAVGILIYWFVSTGDLRQAGAGQHFFQLLAAIGLSIRPLRGLGEHWAHLAEAQGAGKRIQDVLVSTIADINDGKVPKSLSQIEATIEPKCLSWPVHLDHASWNWDTRVRIELSDLELLPGQIIGVYGPSGGGKSTFLRGIAGLISPSHWQCKMPYEYLALHSSYAGQSPFFFHGTLRENLLLRPVVWRSAGYRPDIANVATLAIDSIAAKRTRHAL
jgi:ABC-type multidrug transport system fused ATPase/permease subunit